MFDILVADGNESLEVFKYLLAALLEQLQVWQNSDGEFELDLFEWTKEKQFFKWSLDVKKFILTHF